MNAQAKAKMKMRSQIANGLKRSIDTLPVDSMWTMTDKAESAESTEGVEVWVPTIAGNTPEW